jgi:hypothetical protein
VAIVQAGGGARISLKANSGPIDEVQGYENVPAKQSALEYDDARHRVIFKVNQHAVNFADVAAIARSNTGAYFNLHFTTSQFLIR